MHAWRVQGLRDPHAKVRWAACQAVGQLCTDLGPDMQEAEHARLLPGLMSVMDDFAQPRVQAHAAAAVVNFSENCEQVPLRCCPSCKLQASRTCMPLLCQQSCRLTVACLLPSHKAVATEVRTHCSLTAAFPWAGQQPYQ